MIEVITSFNEHYWNLIGQDCVESWQRYWSAHFHLTCYVENFEMPITHRRVKQIDFGNLDPDYFKLQSENLHHSIKRFAKKAYSLIHAMNHSRARWIIWLDADVITQQPVNWKTWHEVLQNQYLAAYMGVTYHSDKTGRPGQWLVPETGVFAVNRSNPHFDAFRSEYQRRYQERDHSDLRRFYDNDVFGAALQSTTGAQLNDLCAGFAKAYKTPLRHTVLGPYLTHYKAKHSKVEYSEIKGRESSLQDLDISDDQ
jgi:hypothetical protein